MSRHALFFLSLVLGVCLTSGAPAQGPTLLSEIVLDPSTHSTGVTVSGDVAWCSLYADGVQVAVDVSNPGNPVLLRGGSFNPPYGDQWAEHFRSDDWLITGHRGGGVALYDVTTPSSPAILDSVPTNDHYAGLDVLTVGSFVCLFYSERDSSGLPGGVIAYDIAGAKLVQTGASLASGRDGCALTVTPQLFVYQIDAAQNDPNRANTLNVYDATIPGLPVFSSQFSLGNSVAEKGGNVDILSRSSGDYLFVANRGDGLKVVDVQTPASPILVATFDPPGVEVQELTLPRDDFLVVTGVLPGGFHQMVVLNVANPVSPIPTTGLFGRPGFEIHDIWVAFHPGPRLYVVGRDTSSGAGLLQIWR